MSKLMPVLPIYVVGCALILWPVIVAADGVRPYIQSDIFLQSEPITIDGALNEWREGEFSGGESQYASIWLETGVRKDSRAVAALYRQEYQSTFSEDAADYYYGTQQHQLDANRTYQLKLNTRAFKAKGLRVQQTFQPVNELTVSIGGGLFQAAGLQDGILTGQAVTDSSGKDQTYNALVNYQYDQDRLLDRPGVVAPKGIGYALDSKLDWQASEKLGISIVAKDILGEINWKDVPYTDAKLTSNVKTVGSNGFIEIQPAISGKEGYLDSFKQTLHPKVDAVARYQIDGGGKAVSAIVKHVPKQTLWGIGGNLPVRNGQLSASVLPEAGLLNVRYSRKRFEFSVGMDDINPADANTVWVAFGIQ